MTQNSFKKRITGSLIFNIIVAIGIVFLLFQYIFMNDKVGYIDSAKILNEYKGAGNAKKTYDIKAKRWQSNIDTLTNEVQKAIKEYEKGLNSMSSKEQQLSKQLIATKQKQLAEYQKAIQENANLENSKLLQGVVSQVNAFLLKYGKEHNYKLILIANQSGTIAYAREGLDITNDVIQELNEEYGKN